MDEKKPTGRARTDPELKSLLVQARKAGADKLQQRYIRSLWQQVSTLSRDLESAKARLSGLPEQEDGAQAGRYARALQTCAQTTWRLDQLRRQLYQAARQGSLFEEGEGGGLQIIWREMPPPRGPGHG